MELILRTLPITYGPGALLLFSPRTLVNMETVPKVVLKLESLQFSHIARVCAIRGEALFNDRNKLKLFKNCRIDLFLYVGKTDVINICSESHFEFLLEILDGLVVFSKAYNLFQSNWNFILFHINNEISIKFQHFCLVDEC
jgi:hypothetical protein